MSATTSADATMTVAARAPRWATAAAYALGVFFAGLGLMRLLPIATDQWLFEDWGVPWWLRTGAAAAELLAGGLLFVRRLRILGAVGVFTIMVSAGTMHAALGHSMILSALLNGLPAVLAAAVAWAHRRQLAVL
ncbi:MAG: hypothetical protein GEV07_02960 [Streptosporangiales bacterium]|nr:hypothetical protein [Streptosporangiales bacterium]